MENINEDKPDEVSVKSVVLKIKSAISYLKSKWLIIAIFSLVGGVLGIAYAILKKPTYTAVSTFVLEDKSSGGGGAMSQYAGLASLAGIDMGGGNGGLFQGDNIIELYKSRLMIEKALLSNINLNGKSEKLIDLYIDFSGFRHSLEKQDLNVAFNDSVANFNRHQDSLINVFTETINKSILMVSKPDKKLSIIRVEVTSKNEVFSKLFSDKLVEMVNKFYIQTKTKQSSQILTLLQHQADSVRSSLNSSISGVASSIDAAPNANPLLQSLHVPSQKRQVDVQANTAIYAEVIKNLEATKMSLRQETPLIQLIDSPVYPLKVTKTGKVAGFITGFILAMFGCVLYLSIRRFSIIVMR
jgi:hypothetical protein